MRDNGVDEDLADARGMSDMTRVTATCLICNAPLSYLQQVQKEPFCGAPCRAKYATLPPHEVCTICGRVLAPRQFGVRLCSSLDCQRKLQEEARERERRERQMLQERAEALLNRVAKVVELEEPDAYRPIVLPSSSARMTNLPERRRRHFRDILNRLIGEATARPAKRTAGQPGLPVLPNGPVPEVQAVLSKGCALCRGRCCEKGGDRAFLTAETIRRYMARHPDQRPRDVLAAYLDHLGNKTAENSCVFHGAAGCRLPRDMRSDICNQFFCTGLVELQQGLTAQAPARAFFVSMSGQTVRGAAFCDEKEFRPVPPSPANEFQPEP